MAKDEEKPDPLYQPISDEERVAIRAELRERNRKVEMLKVEHGKEGQKLFAQFHHAERQAALSNAADFQKTFVRFAFLLNGGAVIALLTLIGALGGKYEGQRMVLFVKFARKLMVGGEFFLAGLAAAAIAAGVALLAWQFSAATYLHAGHTSNIVSGLPVFGGLDEKEETKNFDRSDKFAPAFMNVTALLSCVSLTLFVIGAYKAVKAFSFFSLLR